MSHLVRVRDTITGHHYTIARAAKRDRHRVLTGADALDANGKPLPPKPDLPKPQTKRAATSKADATKEGK